MFGTISETNLVRKLYCKREVVLGVHVCVDLFHAKVGREGVPGKDDVYLMCSQAVERKQGPPGPRYLQVQKRQIIELCWEVLATPFMPEWEAVETAVNRWKIMEEIVRELEDG